MSDSKTITWEGKKLNSRDEEKFLDDKLMELGLLEPGMTLQEKRDLASVVLESTRMAQEQMNQRSEEENWEVMIVPQDEKCVDRNASKEKEIINKADKSAAGRTAKASTNAQESSGTQSCVLKDLLLMIKDDNIEENERERREKRGKEDNRKKKEEKRLESIERDDKARESIRKRERRAEEEKRKETKGEEEEREREQRELQKRKRERTKTEEMGKEGVEKAVEKSECLGDAHKSNAESRKGTDEIKRKSFYGLTSLAAAKHPNPLGSEIYGSTRRNCMPRVAKVSLVQLIEDSQDKVVKSTEECVRKGNEPCKKMPERRIADAKEFSPSSKGKDVSEEKDSEDHNKSVRRYGRGRTLRDSNNKGSPAREMESESKNPFRKGEPVRLKESKKRGELLKITSLAVDGALSSLSGNGECVEGSPVVNCEKRRRRKPEREALSAEEGVEGKGGEDEDGDLSGGDVKSPGEKKRKLGRGQLTKKWADVVASKDSEASGTEDRDEEKDPVEIKSKKVVMPNKRWRRVKRKFKSSYGSGSEVDEWISSEEERKIKVEPLTKEQIVARLDNCLMLVKDAMQNEVGQSMKKVDNHRCMSRNKYKVPPGFQEPDSDDDWNLWKICFADKSAAKGKSLREETKHDAVLGFGKKIVTRSRTRLESCPSPNYSSKSPSSVEEDSAMRSSPLHLSPLKAILPGSSTHPDDEIHSASKSPSLKDITLFDKVTCPIPRITRSTQTLWDDDGDSNHSTSSSSTVIRPIPQDVSQEPKPMWDLLEIDAEDCDEASVIERSEDGKKLEVDMLPYVTKRRPRNGLRNSPLYLQSEDDATPSIIKVIETPDGEVPEHLTEEPVSYPSFSRKIKSKELENNARTLKARPEGRSLRKAVKEEKGSGEEEIVEQEEVDLTTQEERMPEPVTCPICNRAFPMSEIEVHASGCNPEEDDESSREAFDEPQPRRDLRYRAGMAESAGASHQRFKMDVDEEEEEEVDDSYFEADKGEGYGPRPPQLASFVPISQQKDSLIDYNDQFPHRSAGVNLQTSLERMQKSLMRGGKKKSGWRKRKRGKWRRGVKK